LALWDLDAHRLCTRHLEHRTAEEHAVLLGHSLPQHLIPFLELGEVQEQPAVQSQAVEQRQRLYEVSDRNWPADRWELQGVYERHEGVAREVEAVARKPVRTGIPQALPQRAAKAWALRLFVAAHLGYKAQKLLQAMAERPGALDEEGAADLA